MRLSYIDLEQAESRVVGAICLRLFGDPTYLDAQESGDPHTLICSMCWTDLPWPKDFSLASLKASGEKVFPPDLVRAAKEVAAAKASRNMSYRDLGKRLAHLTNYYGEPESKRFEQAYFAAFPSISRWHRWVRDTIQTKHELTTMLGRRFRVFKDITATSTLREMIAFEPQSVGTGDYMNAGLMELHEQNLPLYILKQVHDAVTIEYDRRDEDWLIPEVCNIISWSFDLHPHADRLKELQQKPRLIRAEREDLTRLLALQASPRPFSIPAESMVGWNLSKRTAKNPNGLILWEEGEPNARRRILTKPVTPNERITSLCVPTSQH